MIRSRKHTHAPLMALMALMASLPVLSHANSTAEAPAPQRLREPAVLPTLQVKGKRATRSFKAERPHSDKLTQPLLDTPQTVSVINRELMQEQAATTLMQALQNTPGITLQLGENGNTAAGDTFQMRGFAAQSSLLVDGIRDLGAVTRDTFNIEQVDVVKGDSGADVGRSTSSGYLNLSSKLPSLRNSHQLGSVLATDGQQLQKRLTADFNQRTGEHSALRLNLMVQDQPQLGRDEARQRGFGIAPAMAFGLGTPLRTTVYAQYVEQHNRPDGGIPTVGLEGFYFAPASNSTADQAIATLVNQAPRVARENFYGSRDDFEDITAAQLTARVEYDLSDRFTLRSTLRHGQSDMDRIMTGVYTLQIPAATAADRSTWQVRQLPQGVDQHNEILTSQTSLSARLLTGTVAHDVVAGLELLRESQRTDTLALPSGTPNLYTSLYHPSPAQPLIRPRHNGAYSDGQTDTLGVYVFDTVKFTDRVQLTAGVRADRYDTQTDGVSAATSNNVTTLTPYSLSQRDTLISWKVGAVFKPVPAGSLYASHGTSSNPPGGSNFALSNTAGSINGASMQPSETRNSEIGIKWELLQRKLLLTAAAYRTEVENELTQLDPVTNTYSQLGRRQVQGLELSAVGKLSAAWDVNFGLATLDTKIKQGTTGNNSAGAATRWSPELTATLWSSHALNRHWKVGGGARYVSEQKRVVDPSVNTATQNMPSIPAYWVADAMVQYSPDRNTTLRLNLNNLTDEDYISTLNNSGARVSLGAPRTVVLSGEYRF